MLIADRVGWPSSMNVAFGQCFRTSRVLRSLPSRRTVCLLLRVCGPAMDDRSWPAAARWDGSMHCTSPATSDHRTRTRIGIAGTACSESPKLPAFPGDDLCVECQVATQSAPKQPTASPLCGIVMQHWRSERAEMLNRGAVQTRQRRSAPDSVGVQVELNTT
jgi:hypothetical protein